MKSPTMSDKVTIEKLSNKQVGRCSLCPIDMNNPFGEEQEVISIKIDLSNMTWEAARLCEKHFREFQASINAFANHLDIQKALDTMTVERNQNEIAKIPCPNCDRRGLHYADHPHAMGFKEYDKVTCRFCHHTFRITEVTKGTDNAAT